MSSNKTAAKDFACGKNIAVFGADYCKYCNSAKELLKKNNIDYQYVDLDLYDDNLKKTLKEENNYKTIPIIFLKKDNNYIFIGGYDKLYNHLNNS